MTRKDSINIYLQFLDDITDDNGVTNAFLLTHLTILLNAKAILNELTNKNFE